MEHKELVRQLLKRLPIHERLFHRIVRRHYMGLLFGMLIAIGGAKMEMYAAVQSICPETFWKAISWAIHAFGCIPVLRHGEALWDIFQD